MSSTTGVSNAGGPLGQTTTRNVARERLISFVGRYGTIIALVLLIVVFSAMRPTVFLTPLNFFNILNQVSILGIIGLGVTVALVQGLFDLSVAGVATLGGYLATSWLASGIITSPILAIALVLMVAVVIGIVSGTFSAYFGISSFIVTLAVGAILTGVVLGISRSQTVLSGIPKEFLVFGQGRIGPIPAPVLFLAGVAIILYIVLEHTQVGRHMYAIGGNAETARLSGIAVKRYALIGLAISAVCAALAGIIVSANLGVGRPQGVGDTYLLDAFAAAFIGAATLRPGRFHILGTVIGVLLIGVINNGLSIMGVETFWQYIVRGSILLVALLGASLLSARRK